MPHIAVIGGAGHIGSYLVPALVRAGHRVTCITRGQSRPYLPDAAWAQVEQVTLDRETAEADGTFGPAIAALGADAVVDMICFTPASAAQLADALTGRTGHLVHIGTIWVHGPSATTPTREEDARAPFGTYGTDKSLIEDMLLARARAGGLPATVVRPGHIVGPGWAPLNPAGHFNPQVFRDIHDGKPLALPNWGMETVHHVHAQDVAQVVHLALDNWATANGHAFNAVSPAAVTLRGYAEAMFRHFGHDPRLTFAPFDDWARDQTPQDAEATRDHIARSPCHSIAKAQRLLGYAPRWTSLAAVQDSVARLLA
jgi:nucleoside-diphosphate-sugar epimerase